MLALVTFLALFATGLASGALAILHFGLVPVRRGYPPSVFTEVHQSLDRAMNPFMPIATAVGALAAGARAVLLVETAPRAALLAAVGVAAMGGITVITFAAAMPLNRRIAGWSIAAPPDELPRVRDRWDRIHALRTLVGMAGFAALLASTVVGA